MKNRLSRHQSGFTLIEIAIVLVIIGILIVGVLQGQEMIENSKTKSVVRDMQGVAAAYNSYIDRYRVPPGDELAASFTARGWTAATGFGAPGGNGDGILNISLASTFTNADPEEETFWSALYKSGFLSGDGSVITAVALPRHRAGGIIGVTTGGLTTVYGQSGPSVCASGLSSKQAAAIDIAIDGPLPANQVGNNVGRVRGASGAANPLAPGQGVPGAAAYSDANLNPWTVCMKM